MVALAKNYSPTIRRARSAPLWQRSLRLLLSKGFVLTIPLVLGMMYIFSQQMTYDEALILLDTVIPNLRKDENTLVMEEWREDFKSSCQSVLENIKGHFDQAALDEKEKIEKIAVSSIKLPEPSGLRGVLPIQHQKYEFCRNAFIDLGTNIGDSIGYFVDNAIDVCSPLWVEANPKTKFNADFPRPHLDVTDLKIHNKGYGANPLFGMLQKYMGRSGEQVILPEATCVYGMEGNPAFTERLQRLENFIVGMKPRPVQHLHILTESVVTAVDGPTKLYLDKVSVAENVSITSFFDA